MSSNVEGSLMIDKKMEAEQEQRWKHCINTVYIDTLYKGYKLVLQCLTARN